MGIDASIKFELVLPDGLWTQLHSHLFPGDGDEHGAVILAGIARRDNCIRLLARNLFLAKDGTDYVPGQRGYRMLTSAFITEKILMARDEGLAYLAIHNHGGANQVSFSTDDLRSHERGYPALRDIARGQIVGGLVFAANAVAGDLWTQDGRHTLDHASILGSTFRTLYPSMPRGAWKISDTYDRQVLLFGERGQAILQGMRVGVIGLGGVGSIVCELLARLGVGSLVLVDPDRIDPTNIPRTLGSHQWDALTLLRGSRLPIWIQEWARRQARHKVVIAKRQARKANPKVKVMALARSVVDVEAANELSQCDYLFLAADTNQARLLFNAITQQYFIPGVQLGAKVPVEKNSRQVGDVFSVARPILPGVGCLWCNGLISAAGLQDEAQDEGTRKRQRYVDDPDVHAPSVVSLNAVAAAHGVNDFLFRVTGLRNADAANDNLYVHARQGETRYELPRTGCECMECSNTSTSRYGRGSSVPLPILGK